MKRLSLLLPLMAAPAAIHAQKAPSETEAVKQTVTAFFDGMRRGDSTAVRRTLAPAAVFHSFGSQPPTLKIVGEKGRGEVEEVHRVGGQLAKHFEVVAEDEFVQGARIGPGPGCGRAGAHRAAGRDVVAYFQ